MRFLPAILAIVLAIYSWVEIAQSDPRQVRQLPRWSWALLILIPFVGAIGWLVYGRPNGTTPRQPTPQPKPRPLAPDDDPDFLRKLKRRPPPPEDPFIS
jgi:hypothetical protein